MDFLLHLPLAQGRQITPEWIAATLIVIFFAIGIHEYAHAKLADMAGDPTPGYYGRVTLNLFNHFDPLGALMIFLTAVNGFGIGWGKPVPMDPNKMRNPRWDHFAAVIGGPLSNLFQAVIWAVLLRFVAAPFGEAGSFFLTLCTLGVLINVGLFLFNLIPLGPLDGMWIVGTFLPTNVAEKWVYWNLRTGMFVLLGILVVGWVTPLDLISVLIFGPARFLIDLLI